MLITYVFLWRSDLTVDVFGICCRAESVRNGLNHTDWHTVDVLKIYKRCNTFAVGVLIELLRLLETFFNTDLSEV